LGTISSGPVSVTWLFAVNDGSAEPIQTCGAGKVFLDSFKQAGQTSWYVSVRFSSANCVDSLSFSVETAVASTSVRGVVVKAWVSEFLRVGGSSDFYVHSVVFCS